MAITLGLFALALFVLGAATAMNTILLFELHAAQRKILVSICVAPPVKL